MTWPTHALLGINSLWLLAPLPPEILKLLGTNFKPFLLPAQVVHRSDQHRGLLHSL